MSYRSCRARDEARDKEEAERHTVSKRATVSIPVVISHGPPTLLSGGAIFLFYPGSSERHAWPTVQSDPSESRRYFWSC